MTEPRANYQTGLIAAKIAIAEIVDEFPAYERKAEFYSRIVRRLNAMIEHANGNGEFPSEERKP